ncbi:tripartite tricarboxylate transporter permease [Antarctobacter sp.]|uniref:tripartite tricarboxylate transporter permease n=1 Tax=Antarctobacter sp. TaxID=1872577 RepID=UPI003A935EAD
MQIIDGFAALFGSWQPAFFAILGTLVGLAAGAIPGLTGSTTIALLLPVTFYLDPLSALALIYTVSKSSDFAGSIPGILFNTPGTPQAAATAQEGFPLTQQGKQGKAMKMAVLASAQGDFLSELLLIFGAAYLAGYAAQMGPPEYVAVYFCAFIVIASVIGDSVIKGILSTLLGLLLAMIGADSITGFERFDFGFDYLLEGLSLVPVLLGVLVLSEVFARVLDREEMSDDRKIAPESERPEDRRVTWSEYRRCFPVMLRSSAIGTFIGMLPGLGATIASFVAYGEARRVSKSTLWGKGEIEGIAAAEASNNATSGANLIPMLTLGIPGSTTAAMLAGVMVIHGMTVGPMVFVESYDLVYGLFAAGLLCIFTYLIVGYFGSALLGRAIALIPVRMIYPFIFVTCFVAAYAVRQAVFDMVIMLIFGLVGFAMRRLGMSLPAFIIAFILGHGAEASLRRTMLLDDSGALIFLERPIALVFFAIGLLTIVLRIRAARVKARNLSGAVDE